MMRRRNVSTAARLAVHNAILVPTLLYGSRRMKERLMLWRCDLFVGYAESAYLIESAMKRYTGWQVLARMSRQVLVRMKNNVLSWFGHVEQMSDGRMAKKN